MTLLLFLCMAASPQIQEMGEAQLNEYVEELSAREPRFEERLEEVVLRSVGTAYQDGPLGEGPTGTYDTDPLVDLKRVDCVTYVEQSVALASGASYPEALDSLRAIRYKDGKADFESRNHFMISDWIRNNPYCIDVTRQLGVETRSVVRTISKKDFFELVKAPGLGQDTPDEEVTLHYVPSETTGDALDALPGPSLIVFVGKVDWLFALHCGVLLRDDNDEPLLYHASSKAGKVVGVPLDQYMREQADRYIGFTAYRIEEPALYRTE